MKSWAVPKGPSLDPHVKRLAVHVEDHPLAYGSFEGLIPAGEYGGGVVLLWDTGTWECHEPNAQAAYKKGQLSFSLKGKKLKGSWKLIRLNNDPKNWLLMKVEDQYSKLENIYNVLEKKPKSVKSAYNLEKLSTHLKARPLAKKIVSKKTSAAKVQDDKMPTSISPELATLVNKPPTGEQWLHEVKFDGYRILAFIHHNKVSLKTRGQKDWTTKFKALEKTLGKLPLKSAIFDGEVVALNPEQRSDFQLLQNSIHNQDTSNLIYYIFDLLYYDGKDLTQLPLSQRKAILQKLIPTSSKTLRYSDHLRGQGEKLFKESCHLALEGIVSKNANSAYEQKRSSDWLKVKCIKRQEFLVLGFTEPKGKRAGFGSLLLGVNSKDEGLSYCGHVGTGFTEDSLATMTKRLKKQVSQETPLLRAPKGIGRVTWVKPTIIVEVEFTEWTKDGILRHPSFKGIRSDKKPADIIREEPKKTMTLNSAKNKKKKTSLLSNEDTTLTHPDKILYPEKGIIKLALATYYKDIQDWILPHLIKRPLTLVRCPQGWTQQCFFQKHLNENHDKALYSTIIQEEHAKEPYLYLKNAAGLQALVQLNALEIHSWGCHITKIENPDLITFDLDPSPEVAWKKVIETAFLLKEELEKLHLQSFVKTTGGKGLHVVLPIEPKYNWKEIVIFTHTFVNYLVSLKPDLYLATMSKTKRKNKIFLDYLRNQRGATAVVPYSTRAKENAPVATPLSWDELTIKLKSDSFNLHNLPERLKTLKKDPWEDFFAIKQKLRLPSAK